MEHVFYGSFFYQIKDLSNIFYSTKQKDIM